MIYDTTKDCVVSDDQETMAAGRVKFSGFATDAQPC